MRTVLTTRQGRAVLPDGFASITSARLDRDLLASIVPDIAGRHVFIAGRHVFIAGAPSLCGSIGAAARSLHAKSVEKDYFSGY